MTFQFLCAVPSRVAATEECEGFENYRNMYIRILNVFLLFFVHISHALGTLYIFLNQLVDVTKLITRSYNTSYFQRSFNRF